MSKETFTVAIIISVLLVSLVTGLQSVAVVEANPKTITVPDDYASIQAAINNAANGDTIYIKKGVYVENPVVNRSISLVGEDMDTTIIDVTAGLQVKGNNATITGLTIYDGWHAISLSASYCNISGNKITDSTHGIVLFGCEGNNITGNIFKSIDSSSAIQLNYANRNLITKNYIESCVEGIQIWQYSTNNTVTENTLTNIKATAISFQYSNYNIITRNNVSYSNLGTSIYGSSWNTISNNNYFYNKVQFGAGESYYLTFGNNRSINTINCNYWSDYNGTDSNSDGIGDLPYTIDANNKDNHPFIAPVNFTESSNPTPSLNELPYAAGNFYPTPNATNVPLNTTISISFSRPPSICDLNITPNVPIQEKTFEAEGFGATYIFHFAEQLAPQTTYTVTVIFGQETAPEGSKPTITRTWHFTTETNSPTQQPTLSPTPTIIGTTGVDFTQPLIMWSIIALTIAIGVVAYFYFKKRGG